MKYTTHSLEEMQKLAEDFVAGLKMSETGATVVGLYGDLGAGKTTFTQSVAHALGVEETVVSPTFVIEKIYELPKSENVPQKFTHLIHIDAYRLEQSSELIRLGWQDITTDPDNLILIEWSERVADIMPKHIRLNFTHVSENVRETEVFN
jgi:tRNA threonylcarbamoyladenosine biosynthesis protein TsaE